MTSEHEEAVRLAEKHGGTVIDYSLPGGPQAIDTTVIIATSELAALIAEVRRDERETFMEDLSAESKRLRKRYTAQDEHAAVMIEMQMRTIRARLEEGK